MGNELKPGECRWVSVEERLPSHDKIIPVLHGGKNEDKQAYFVDQVWWRSQGRSYGVTHWLEVCPPAPPKRTKRVERSVHVTLDVDGEIQTVYHNYPPNKAIPAKIVFETEE